MTNQYFFQTLPEAEQHVAHTETVTAEQLAHYRTISARIPLQTINGQDWRMLATRSGNVFYKQ
jgi:hypothetical protein